MNKFTLESTTTTLEFTEIEFRQRAMSCHRNSLAKNTSKTFNNAKINDDHNEFKPALHIKQ